MNIFKKSLAAAAAAIIALSNVCSGNVQPLIGNIDTVTAESYGDVMEYDDYLSYKKVDKDEDDTFDYIEISACDKSAVSVKIPSEIDGLPVTSIGASAFSECTDLESITIPDSVISIEYDAFSGCTGLTSVKIPNSVTRVRHGAFKDCGNLTSVEIPDSVTSIGSDVFNGTPLLEYQDGVTYACKWAVDCDRDVTEAKIRSGTKGIAAYAFFYCEDLTSVTIPDSVTSIGDWSFEQCTGLTSVIIPEGVTSIGIWAFRNCSALENVTIPESVTSIGDQAFDGTPFLKNQVGVKYAGKWVIGCDEDVTNAKIKSGTKGIADHAFYGCKNLTDAEIPDSVTKIEYGAFGYCENLTSVTIKNPECEIGDSGAVCGLTICNGYDENDKPYYNGVIRGYKNSKVQAYAEKYDYKFEAIGENPPVTTAPPTTTLPTATTIVDNDPLTYLDVDKDGDGISDYVVVIGCNKSAEEIIIPSEFNGLPVIEIGYAAFSGCTALTSVTIPDSVTSIEDEAFDGTPFLENQTGVKYAGKWVIGCDKDVKEAEIKFGTKGIADRAFYKCSSLTGITIPDSVTKVGYAAFASCENLTSVEIPDSVTEIEDMTFDGCENLTSVTIPESVTYIGFAAFRNCTGLTSIMIENPKCKIFDYGETICNGIDEYYIPYYNGVIRGYKNSTAQTYAKEYGYKFEAIGEDQPVTTATPTTTAPTTNTTLKITTAKPVTTKPVTTAPVVTTKPIVLGDVNGNDDIDLYDAIEIAKSLIGKRKFTDEEKKIADFNKDGYINLYDAIDIAKALLKKGSKNS